MQSKATVTGATPNLTLISGGNVGGTDRFESVKTSPILSRSGSDGGDGRMLEARVQNLEVDMKEVKADLKVIRTDLAELKGKVSMLPGYPGIAAIVGLIGGILLIAARLLPGAN